MKVLLYMNVYIPQFGKFSTENISLIKIFKVKYFCGCMTSLKYFYLEYISLAIIYTHYWYRGGAIDRGKLLILIATTLQLLCTIYNLALCQMSSNLAILSVHTHLSIKDNQCLRETTWLCETSSCRTTCSSIQLAMIYCYSHVY